MIRSYSTRCVIHDPSNAKINFHAGHLLRELQLNAHSISSSTRIVPGFAGQAAADVSYSVSVNTGSLSGTSGSLDFNFNPGPLISQLASADIQNFSDDGSLSGSPILTGDVSGTLPSTVAFDNAGAFNDYFEGFTFGNTLMFDVHLYGPAVNSPDGVSTSGSSFGFSMFSDSAGTIPALTIDADGFAFTVAVNLNGTTTVTDFSSQTSVEPAISPVPEKSSLAPVGTAIALLAVFRLRRKARS